MAIKGRKYINIVSIKPNISVLSLANNNNAQPSEPCDASRYGTTLDTFWGAVSEDGVLSKSALPAADVRLDGITEIGAYAMEYMFYNNEKTASFIAPNLLNVNIYGMRYSFFGSGLTRFELPLVTKIYSYGLQYCCSGCDPLQIVDLHSLVEVETLGLSGAFNSCPNITNIDLSSLTIIGPSGMSSCLQSVSAVPGTLKRIDFPALTSIQTNSFGTSSTLYTFRYRTTMEEIHFRADMQTTIEAMSGYADKWGATNATIYFDL